MTYFIAILGTGKGTWAALSHVMRQGNFERSILITNQFGKEHFTPDTKTALLEIDFDKPMQQMRDEIKERLPPLLDKFLDTDVAVSLISGAGPEHMALMAALLQLGLGVRLITTEFGKDGIVEL